MAEVFEVAQLAENLDEALYSVPEEPRLKYKSVLHGISTITSSDTISCVAPHDKFLVIGTVLGRVHILDHEGFLTENGVHSMHRGPVNQLSISTNGDFMASCSDDGRVAVYNLSDANESEVFNMDEEVKSVAISPDYSRSPVLVIGHSRLLLLTRGVFKRSKHGEIIKANGLIRSVKWRGDILLWTDDTRVGVYDLRDHQHISFVQFSQQACNLYTRLVPCHITWCTDTCFLIGRGNSLRICQIIERYQTTERRSSSRGSSRSLSSSIHLPGDTDTPTGLTNRYLELSYSINLVDSLVCGVSRHQGCLLALIVPNISLSTQSNMIPLEVQVIEIDDLDSGNSVERNPVFHKEQQTWLVPRGPRGYGSINLESVPGENTHYIMTPRELIRAEELMADDRIDWFLEQKNFEEALQLAFDHPRQLERYTSQSVGLIYVEYLLEVENFDMAASICAKVIVDKAIWNEQIDTFMRLEQLTALLPHIPLGNREPHVQLDSALYETILIYFMDRDPAQFIDLLSRWCKYDLLDSFDGLLRTLLDRIERHTSVMGISEVTVLEPSLRNLWQGLAVLYELVGSTDKALNILIQLCDPKVFDLFQRRPAQSVDARLIEVLKDRVDYFVQLCASKAVPILLDHVSAIPVEYVISQLENKPELLYHYLDGAHLRYPKLVAPYTTQLIQLYTQFGREKLLPLLRSTDSYRLSEALTICERAKLVPETVYLLTRVGRRHDALHLIMTQGGDAMPDPVTGKQPSFEERQSAAAAAAIAYCCEEDCLRSRTSSKYRQSESIFGVRLNKDDESDIDSSMSGEHDGELWQQVVLFAVDKPAFICALLQHAGSEGLDPRLLLRKISPDLSIPGLRDSLVKLMHNYKLQFELHRNCRRILRNDANKLFQKLIKEQPRGIRIQPNAFSSIDCSVCLGQLLKGRFGDVSDNPHPPDSQDACVVFRCKHICHSLCLSATSPACPVCTNT